MREELRKCKKTEAEQRLLDGQSSVRRVGLLEGCAIGRENTKEL